MRDVFIVSTARTPVGRRKGYLREWNAPELLGKVLELFEGGETAGAEPADQGKST